MGPSWLLFPPRGAAVERRPPFVGFMLFSDFLVVLAPSWPNLGSILEGLGLHSGGFWGPGPPFCKFWGSIFEVSGHDLGPMRLVILVLVKLIFFYSFHWYGMGWWGYAVASRISEQHGGDRDVRIEE